MDKIAIQIWSRYPPLMRQIADQVEALEKTNPRSASQLIKKFPQIMKIREEILAAQQAIKPKTAPQIKPPSYQRLQPLQKPRLPQLPQGLR